MKILVMGTGGIGGYFGGRLAEAGADIFFIARGAHLEAMQQNGLIVKSVAGDFHLKKVNASSNPKDAGTVDVVMLATKTYDIEEAVALVKPTLKKEGFLVHLQNGIDIADRISKIIEPSRIVGGISYGVVQITEPGHIDHSTKFASLTYGPFQNPPPSTLGEFHRICQSARFESNLVEDIKVRIWSKFLFICAYSGVTSLMRLPMGRIMGDEDTRALYKSCMNEIFEIAKAKSVILPSNLVQDRLDFSMTGFAPTATSSMQRDFAAGRRTELASLNGTVSRMGKELNVPTPINDFIFASLKLHDPNLYGTV
jgi:2-dehydropantoate 2-reductase